MLMSPAKEAQVILESTGLSFPNHIYVNIYIFVIKYSHTEYLGSYVAVLASGEDLRETNQFLNCFTLGFKCLCSIRDAEAQWLKAAVSYSTSSSRKDGAIWEITQIKPFDDVSNHTLLTSSRSLYEQGSKAPAISLLPYILRIIQEVPENALYNQFSMTIDFSDIFSFFLPIFKSLHLKLNSLYSFYVSLKKKFLLEHL